MSRYSLELYTIDVVNQRFDLRDRIAQWSNLQFFDRLNGIGALSVSFDARDRKITTDTIRRGWTQLVVKDNDTIVWAGPVEDVFRTVQDVNDIVTLQAESYFSHLRYRYTDAVRQFTQVDAGNIAWGLINDSQNRPNGFLGIVQGSAVAIANKDRTYYYKNVAEAIFQLSEVSNPVNFSFTYSQDAENKLDEVLFNTAPLIGSQRTDLQPLILGDNVSMSSWATQGEIYNFVTALGIGTDAGTIFSVAQDVASQQGYTRRERVLPEKDISIQDTLNETAQGELLPTEKYHIELELMPGTLPTPDTYILGDSLLVDFTNLQGSMFKGKYWGRVIEQSINIDGDGLRTVKPKLEITL